MTTLKHLPPQLLLAFVLIGAGVALIPTSVLGQTGSNNLGDLWFSPNTSSTDWKQLFLNPSSWSSARANVSALEIADYQTTDLLSDSELTTLTTRLKDWNMALTLGSGAVKEWGCTADITSKVTLTALDRIKKFGGQVDYISMDEPLVAGGSSLSNGCKLSQQEIANRTANYISLIKQKYPNVQIGDTEPWPLFTEGTLKQWIDQLSAASEYKIAFLTLDVDYQNAVIYSHPLTEIKDIADYARGKGIPFRIIIWNANALYPQQVTDASTEYTATMKFASIAGTRSPLPPRLIRPATR